MTKIRFVHENVMLVDGNYLNLDRLMAHRQGFEDLMRLAAPLIVDHLENLNTSTVLKNPNSDIAIGSIWLGRLAIRDVDPILTDSGYYQRYRTQNNRGVFYDSGNFVSGHFLKDYWAAVENNILAPEVRQGGNVQSSFGLHLLATIKNT